MKKAKRIQRDKLSGWPQRLRAMRPALAVCGLALVIYSRSLFCGFVRDDMPQIVYNQQVQSWEYLPQLLGSHLWSQLERSDPNFFYRPLFSVWMLLVHTGGGVEPWFWHLSSILLHVVATYMVFRLCRRLTGSDIGALAAAAIFAVHPIHVDAVTWVSASCEAMFAIFAMASILALLDHDEIARKGIGNAVGKTGPPLRAIWSSALWYGAALFAKETAIAMLAIYAVCAWMQWKNRSAGEGWMWVWKTASPYSAVTAGYLLVRWAVMRRVGVETGEHSWAQVVFSSPSILLFYLKKLFLPWNLAGSYVNRLTASPTAGFWLGLTAILIGLVAVVWASIRYSSLLALAAAIIVVPILPALAVVRVYLQGDMTHDRYLYLPSVGLSVLFAMFVKRSWALSKPAKTAAIAGVVAVLAAFSVETAFQQRYYQDDNVLYSRILEVDPSNGIAHGMLGNLYLDQKRTDLALEHFRKGVQIDPGNQKAALFLAQGLTVAERYPEAERVLSELLTSRLDPRRRRATLLSLANVEIAQGNLDYAQHILRQVEQSNGNSPDLHWTWGALYQKEGLLPQALAEYEKEFELTGDPLAQRRYATVAKLLYAQSAPKASQGNLGR